MQQNYAPIEYNWNCQTFNKKLLQIFSLHAAIILQDSTKT